jgi:hypothetical protein
MKIAIALSLSLVLAVGWAFADENKADEKKAAKAKPAAKKTGKKESLSDWADKNKIWLNHNPKKKKAEKKQ